MEPATLRFERRARMVKQYETAQCFRLGRLEEAASIQFYTKSNHSIPVLPGRPARAGAFRRFTDTHGDVSSGPVVGLVKTVTATL
jgi:hypothetical protein